MNKIEIGIVTKPQGLKGEFRVKHNLETFKVFKNLKQIEINGVNYTVTKTTDRCGFFVISTKELTTIEQVENLRNAVVYAFVSDEVKHDVNNNVGYTIVANNTQIGVVTEVKNFGSTDVYFLDNGKTFACVPNLIENVNHEQQVVNVNAKILDEVIV